eukprot:scaffold98814_cov73-Phaeocystis_antarctica.AAC.6
MRPKLACVERHMSELQQDDYRQNVQSGARVVRAIFSVRRPVMRDIQVEEQRAAGVRKQHEAKRAARRLVCGQANLRRIGCVHELGP